MMEGLRTCSIALISPCEWDLLWGYAHVSSKNPGLAAIGSWDEMSPRGSGGRGRLLDLLEIAPGERGHPPRHGTTQPHRPRGALKGIELLALLPFGEDHVPPMVIGVAQQPVRA